MNIQRKIIAIVGPTASGKTAIGVKLAKELNGEIVSADSRQVYRGLDIGTGKDLSEYGGVKYHLIDICEPGEEFTLFKYLDLARAAIEDIYSRGKLPIIVGGTGLYVQGLIEGFVLEKSEIRNPKSETNSKFKILNRTKLETKPLSELQEILQTIDIEAFEKLSDQKNPHRLIRAIERAQEGIKTIKIKPDWEVLQIGITQPREILYERIDKRVDERFEQGMLGEAEGLLASGVNPEWLFSLGLEYKVMVSFLISNDKFLISNKNLKSKIKKKIQDSKLDVKTFNEMSQALKLKIHQYAKRQLTWFKRFPEIVWESDFEKIKKLTEEYLK